MSRVIGVVEYEIRDGELRGTWTTAPQQGRLGTEIAVGSGSELAGTYSVTIYGPDNGPVLYEGSLTISTHVSSYNMRWTSPGGPSYAGLGILAGDRLAAAYWDD